MNRHGTLHSFVIRYLLFVIAGGRRRKSPAAWPQWRGPARDGVASAFTVPATWPAQLTKKWQPTVGVGHASPVVAGNRVVVHTRQGNREIVAAYDLESGKQLWQDGVDAPYTMNPAATGHGPGPKSTPAIADGRVFTLGISGIFSAHDLATGKLLWRKNAPPTPPEFGTASSPMVDGDIGDRVSRRSRRGRAHRDGRGDRRREVAMDGRWPRLLVADHRDVRRHAADHRAVAEPNWSASRAADGRLLWEVPIKTPYEQNSVTPLVVGDLVISAGLDNPTIALAGHRRLRARDGRPRRAGATSRCRCI